MPSSSAAYEMDVTESRPEGLQEAEMSSCGRFVTKYRSMLSPGMTLGDSVPENLKKCDAGFGSSGPGRTIRMVLNRFRTMSKSDRMSVFPR